MLKRRIVFAAAGLLAAGLLWAGAAEPLRQEDPVLEEVSRELGVSVRGGEAAFHSDTHGGMGNDGVTCTIVEYGEDARPREVEGSWEPLPLTANLSAAVYGSPAAAPFFTDGEGKNRIPAIEEGWYTFTDRHREAGDPRSDLALFRRASYNFTLGLYDAREDTLYFLKLDT